MAVKLTEEEKREKRIQRMVKEFIGNVRRFLADKNGGEIAPEWEASILLLDAYYTQFLTLTEEINISGMFVQTKNGKQPNPLMSYRDKAAMRLEALMKEMGLTFKTSVKMNLTTVKEEETPLEAFVKDMIEKR